MLREKEVFVFLQKHLGDIVYNGEKLETIYRFLNKELFKYIKEHLHYGGAMLPSSEKHHILMPDCPRLNLISST